ncbi:beta-lactamase [Cladophialophora psammophila CBS 110553]|uniref:Beta-lactamase n=1 Tax=Cladophialophora psammophila CBS 110553 TaxID=1182543 RepID=W9VCH1_9EURO|nr:beta-lactamase [Cladophialophora psammophila CBS 110553]EXJ53307.1 beta-lactamase [Cladophialophora psammophila CBS 110553]
MSFNEQFESATKPGPGRKIVGAVVIAADAAGDIVYHDAKGTTSVIPETARPMTEDTTFWIASCTKLLTTISAMQCVEQSKLNLDDDVSSILDEFKSPDILTGWNQDTGEPELRKATKKITLRQLLTHSSGMGYDFLSPDLLKWRQLRGEAGHPAEGEIRKQYLMPLLFEPGEGWNYSCSIDWAGKMVERVNGGMKLGQYMKKNIWDPLEMVSTGFRLHENERLRSRLCATTARTPRGDLVSADPYPNPNPKDDLGGGGLYASAQDYIKVLVSLLKNDGILLKPETVKLMFSPQLLDEGSLVETVTAQGAGPMFRGGVDGRAWNFGLGGILNMEDVEDVCKKGTMSWGGLPNLFWWIDPSAGNCGMYASQILPPGDLESINLAVAFRREISTRHSGR